MAFLVSRSTGIWPARAQEVAQRAVLEQRPTWPGSAASGRGRRRCGPRVSGSTWETWLNTRMQPPVAGIFSPSIQVRRVVASRLGLTMATATPIAQPRFCCGGRTRRTVTCVLPLSTVSVTCRAERRVCGGQATRSRRRPRGPDRIDAMTGSTYVVLLPVKPPARGKSRLEVDPDRRRGLAAAFALDTARACLAADARRRGARRHRRRPLRRRPARRGCETIPDGVTGDLNESLRLGAAEAARRWPDGVPVAVCADLPALLPEDLDDALGQVSDASGRGSASDGVRGRPRRGRHHPATPRRTTASTRTSVPGPARHTWTPERREITRRRAASLRLRRGRPCGASRRRSPSAWALTPGWPC